MDPAGTDQTAPQAGQLLTVMVGGGRRLAVPLGLVARVSEVDTTAIEPIGSWEVARVDGIVLPLVRVCAPLGAGGPGAGTALTPVVVVRTEHSDEVGIVVDSVEDIVTTTGAAALEQDGLLGLAVVGDRFAGQLDVRAAVAEVAGFLHTQTADAGVGA